MNHLTPTADATITHQEQVIRTLYHTMATHMREVHGEAFKPLPNSLVLNRETVQAMYDILSHAQQRIQVREVCHVLSLLKAVLDRQVPV